MNTVTLPLGFDVPEGWTPVEPEEPGPVFVAVRPEPGAEFTANLTLGVRQRPDPASLEEIADEAVERLASATAAVDVLDRRAVGAPPAPGLTQTLRLRTGEGLELRQVQVHLTAPGPDGGAVLELVLTASAEAAARLVPDFRRFVASVHVRRKTLAGEGEQP